MSSCTSLRLLALMFLVQFCRGQIDTSQCGVTTCCFRYPSDCSGSNCNILIAYKYNQSAGVLDVEFGTKESWVTFGLNNAARKMNGTAGEICIRSSPSPQLKGFQNRGRSPNFNVSTTGLNFKGNEVNNNFLICRYSRPISPPSGSYMLDLNSQHYITSAFGTRVSGSNPGRHGNSSISTSSSSSKVNFLKPCSSSGARASTTNMIVYVIVGLWLVEIITMHFNFVK